MWYIEEILEEIRMFRVLWSAVPSDCRTSLVRELVFEPGNLRARYSREVTFRDTLHLHWLNR